MARSVKFAAPFSLLILALAASPLACAAGEKGREDRLLDEMNREIDGVPSETFAERGAEPGVDSGALPASGPRGADSPSLLSPYAPPTVMATPSLPVVHLAADGTVRTAGLRAGNGAVESADDDGQLPILSLTNASLRPARASHATSPPSARDKDAKRAYDAAQKLVNARRYVEALTALSNFLTRWPEHANASDALYSRGECYLAQGAFANAAQAFEEIVTRFPTAKKAPDALLKLGGVERVLRPQEESRAQYRESPGARPAAPAEADPSSGVDGAWSEGSDEDDEHLVPSDEDNEHLVRGE